MEYIAKLDARFRATQAAGIRTLAARIWLTKGLGMSTANRSIRSQPSPSVWDGTQRK